MLDEEDVNNNDVWNPEYKQRVDIVLVVPDQESVGRSEFVSESRDLVSKLKKHYDDIIMKVIDEDLPSLEYEIIVEIQFV